jgi:hypothetical protein
VAFGCGGAESPVFPVEGSPGSHNPGSDFNGLPPAFSLLLLS